MYPCVFTLRDNCTHSVFTRRDACANTLHIHCMWNRHAVYYLHSRYVHVKCSHVRAQHACQPGGHYWDYYPDNLSFRSSVRNPSEGQANVDATRLKIGYPNMLSLNLQMSDLQISCNDLIQRYGNRIRVSVMAAKVTCPIVIFQVTKALSQDPTGMSTFQECCLIKEMLLK